MIAPASRIWLAIAAMMWLATPAAADVFHLGEPPECFDTTPVVGRAECLRFGHLWTVPAGPPMQLTMGVYLRQLGDHGLELDVADDDVTRRVTGQVPAGLAGGEVLAFNLRVTGEVTSAVYTGLDASIGTLQLEDPQLELRHGVDIEDGGLFFSAGGLAGLVVHLGPVVARGEIVGGVRVLEVPYTVADRLRRTDDVQPMLEPRVAAEIWLGPWATLGAHGGSDVLRSRDYVVGVYLGFYDHGWDGSRPR